MARLGFYLLLFLLIVVVAEGAPKAKKVKCKDKKFPTCYHKDLFCPQDCLRTCVVNCNTCQPVCTPPPPPPPSPPPPPPKQKKVKSPPPPKQKNVKSPPPPPFIFSSPPPPPPSQTSTPSPPLPSPPTSPAPSPPITSTPSPPASGIPPPSSEAAGAKRVRCKNKNFPNCFGMELTCPSACPNQCGVDCNTCSPVCDCNKPGAVCQDPRFVGGDGITFYFHGKKDTDFCIVTDPNLHINAHFIGKRNHNIQRDFTWVQSLGILFDTRQLFIGARKTAIWDDSVDRLSLSFNNQSVFLPETEGATWQSSSKPIVTITRTRGTNAVEIEVERNFKIKAIVVPITEKESLIHKYGITQEDCFAHLDLSFKFYSLSGQVNGVLGQTYATNYVSRVKMGVLMPVLGGDKEFSSSTLFTTDCAATQFQGQLFKGNSSENFEHAHMNCASEIECRGVVCKR